MFWENRGVSETFFLEKLQEKQRFAEKTEWKNYWENRGSRTTTEKSESVSSETPQKPWPQRREQRLEH
jgi:hypothetical protein